MPATNTYSQSAIELLRDWALLAGVSGRIAQDPRMGLLARVLPDFDDGALASGGLCTDGSPLELCERISVKPQAPAFTLEVPEWEGHSQLDALCRALRETASEQDLNETRLRLERIDGRVKTYWIGVDFAQSLRSSHLLSLASRYVGRNAAARGTPVVTRDAADRQ